MVIWSSGLRASVLGNEALSAHRRHGLTGWSRRQRTGIAQADRYWPLAMRGVAESTMPRARRRNRARGLVHTAWIRHYWRCTGFSPDEVGSVSDAARSRILREASFRRAPTSNMKDHSRFSFWATPQRNRGILASSPTPNRCEIPGLSTGRRILIFCSSLRVSLMKPRRIREHGSHQTRAWSPFHSQRRACRMANNGAIDGRGAWHTANDAVAGA